MLNNPLKYTDPTGNWQQTIFDDFYMESLYSKSRGHALVKGQHTYTGKYNCDISNANVAAKLVAGAGASSALILAHGTGRESGWYDSPEGYTLSNIPGNWRTAPADLMVINLNYSHEGWDGLGNIPLHYGDSANYGAELLTGMVTAIGTKTDAKIFVAGHSKGAGVVNRVQRSSANQYITAGAALALPPSSFEDQSIPPHQYRGDPKEPLVFWPPDKSREYGHESVLSVDYAKNVVIPYFNSYLTPERYWTPR